MEEKNLKWSEEGRRAHLSSDKLMDSIYGRRQAAKKKKKNFFYPLKPHRIRKKEERKWRSPISKDLMTLTFHSDYKRIE